MLLLFFYKYKIGNYSLFLFISPLIQKKGLFYLSFFGTFEISMFQLSLQNKIVDSISCNT